MTNATLSATLTVTDILLNGIDSTARFTVKAIRFTIKAARAIWPVIETVGILVLAIALYLGFKTYETGVAFRQWCDRLVADSLKPTALLMPAIDTDDAATADAPDSEDILTEWQDKAAQVAHMATVVEYAATHKVPDWYKEAVDMAVDELNATDAAPTPYTLEELVELSKQPDAELPDWEKEAIAQAIDTLKMVEEYRQVEAWTDLSGYNIRELKKMASAAKIKGYNKMTKAQLIRAIAYNM